MAVVNLIVALMELQEKERQARVQEIIEDSADQRKAEGGEQ